MTTGIWDQSYAGFNLTRQDAERAMRGMAFKFVRGRLLDHFGSLGGLRTLEVGAGLGRVSLGLCREGARTVLLDSSAVALTKAAELFGLFGLPRPEVYQADVLDSNGSVAGTLRGRFDVAMSFGLVEHFSGGDRKRAIDFHFDLVRPGGLVIISVPNRWCPTYRLFVWTKRRLLKNWGLGVEIPFTRKELKHLVADRATVARIVSTPIMESVGDHLLMPIGRKIGLDLERLDFTGIGLGALDRLGYALIMVAER